MTIEVIPQEFVPDYPIDKIHPHPRNANQGDVGALTESMEAIGFYGAVLIQKSTGYILAGNHRTEAGEIGGMKTVPVFVADVDDETALRILAGDNRHTRLGHDDVHIMSDILIELASNTELGLKGSGWDGDDLDAMLHDLQELANDGVDEPEGRQSKPVLVVSCTSEQQAVKLAQDLTMLNYPLRKVSIHCDNAAERDTLKRQLIDLGYAVTSTTAGG